MEYPILYILMRTDMDSMNPGKGMAQAAHAANQFACRAEQTTHIGFYKEWAHYNGFGTTVVLGVDSEASLAEQIADASANGFLAEEVRDPSYPVRDGRVTHLVDIITCGYILVPDRDKEKPSMLGKLLLHL